MEQQLDATYLRPGLISKACALSILAICIGTSILMAAYGISLFWRPMPSSIDARIANPELVVTQDKPLVMVQPDASHIDPQARTDCSDKGLSSNRSAVSSDPREEVIQREVIVFSSVKHGAGSIVTGWKYPNGSGRIPSGQFCYYVSRNVDESSMRVDLAVDGTPLSQMVLTLVPEGEQALKKCNWWHA